MEVATRLKFKHVEFHNVPETSARAFPALDSREPTCTV